MKWVLSGEFLDLSLGLFRGCRVIAEVNLVRSRARKPLHEVAITDRLPPLSPATMRLALWASVTGDLVR